MSGRGVGRGDANSVRRRSEELLVSDFVPKTTPPIEPEPVKIDFEEDIEEISSGDRSKDEFLRSLGKGFRYSLRAPDGRIITTGEAGSKKAAEEAIAQAKKEETEKVLAEESNEQKRDRFFADYKKRGIDLKSILEPANFATRLFDGEIKDLEKLDWPGGYKVLLYSEKHKGYTGASRDAIIPIKRHEVQVRAIVFDENGKYMLTHSENRIKPRTKSIAVLKKEIKEETINSVQKQMAERFISGQSFPKQTGRHYGF